MVYVLGNVPILFSFQNTGYEVEILYHVQIKDKLDMDEVTFNYLE